MKSFSLIVALGLASGSAVGLAAEKTISQKGRLFSEREVSLRTGETIVFLNDDTVAHSVLSTSVGNEFNLGAQLPGEATPVTFHSAGDVNVICAIHPRMRMTVKVTK